MYDIKQFLPIINPPECAILGCGRVEDQAIVKKGKLKIRPQLPLVLSFDHRLHDGASAAKLLGRIKGLLSDPMNFITELR